MCTKHEDDQSSHLTGHKASSLGASCRWVINVNLQKVDIDFGLLKFNVKFMYIVYIKIHV